MASKANEDVSVIVLTKNCARTIERCLRSIVAEKPGEIISVDGMSTDATIDILRRYGIRILVGDMGSLGYARQLGVEAAKGTYAMYVDSDVVLTHGSIGRMRDELQKHGYTGIHAKLLSAENVSYWQKAENEMVLQYYGRPGPRRRIDTIAALFRRDILLKYPFDFRFKESAEDVDLCRRLVSGNQTLGVSNAVAYHYHRRDFSSFLRQRFRNGLGLARLSLKYGDPRILIDPISSAFSQIIRSFGTRRMRFIPYWAVSGLARFAGATVGFSSRGETSSLRSQSEIGKCLPGSHAVES